MTALFIPMPVTLAAEHSPDEDLVWSEPYVYRGIQSLADLRAKDRLERLMQEDPTDQAAKDEYFNLLFRKATLDDE